MQKMALKKKHPAQTLPPNTHTLLHQQRPFVKNFKAQTNNCPQYTIIVPYSYHTTICDIITAKPLLPN
jgi:hypothetical protein